MWLALFSFSLLYVLFAFASLQCANVGVCAYVVLVLVLDLPAL